MHGAKVVTSAPAAKCATPDATPVRASERLGGMRIVLSSPETSAHAVTGGRRVEHAAACMRAAFGWQDTDASTPQTSAHCPAALAPTARSAEAAEPARPQADASKKGGGRGAAASVYTPGLVALANMGFSDEQAALEALRLAKGSVSDAIELLVGASCLESTHAPDSAGRGVCGGHIETARGGATNAAVAAETGSRLGRKGSKAAGKARNAGAGGGTRGKGAGNLPQRGQTLIASFLGKGAAK